MMLETFPVQPTAEEQLDRKRAEGDVIATAYFAGQVRGVTDVTLRDYRTEWPRDTTYASSHRAKSPMVSALEAHDPDFYGDAANAFAQEALGTGPEYTEAMLLDLAQDTTNTDVGRRGARSMLHEFTGHKRRMQAIIAEQRVGWSAIVNNRFVMCPPNGDTVFGHTAQPEALDAFLRKHGYTAMPVDNPYSQPLIDILAKRAGIEPDEVRARGAARQAKAQQPAVAPLDATRVDMQPFPDHTLVDHSAWHSDVDETRILAPVAVEAEVPMTPMTPFAFAAALGRIVNSNLYPQAADAIHVTTAHIITGGDIHTGFANYTPAQREALGAALGDIARRPVVSDQARVLRQEAQDALDVLNSLQAA